MGGGESPTLDLSLADESDRDRRPLWREVLSRPEGILGVLLITAVVLLILVGPAFAPYPGEELGVGPPSSGPSGGHLLGTDALGRDLLSRVLAGGGSVILVPIIAVVLSQIIGGGLGLIAGYKGGWLDAAISRFFDISFTLPPLLLVLVLIAGLGTSRLVLVIVVTLVFVPRAGRIVRGSTRQTAEEDYVLSAVARGESTTWIIANEIVPNIIGPATADAALRLGYAIIFVATLNFLGLGVQPPAPDWGVMIAENRSLISVTPLAVFVPAAAIGLLAVGVNLLADVMTDQWSPDVREGPAGL